MKRIKTVTMASAMTLMMAGCNKVELTPLNSASPSNNSSGGDIALEVGTQIEGTKPMPMNPGIANEIAERCDQALAQGRLKTEKKRLVFQNTRLESGRRSVCQFGIGSNGPIERERIQARYEQVRRLQLPSNAVLCDFDVSTRQQTFRYDDIFYFTLNGVILATNQAASLNNLRSEVIEAGTASVEFKRYSWASIFGQPLNGPNGKSEDYCLGGSQGLASCKWPVTETTGEIRFDFDRHLLIALGQQSSNGSAQEFGLAVTGDDDVDKDCSHDGLDFELSVQYFVQ